MAYLRYKSLNSTLNESLSHIGLYNFIAMLSKTKKSHFKNYCSGQSMIEYILLFVAVIVVLIVAAGPSGIISNKLDESLGKAAVGVKCMTNAICYDPDPTACATVCP